MDLSNLYTVTSVKLPKNRRFNVKTDNPELIIINHVCNCMWCYGKETVLDEGKLPEDNRYLVYIARFHEAMRIKNYDFAHKFLEEAVCIMDINNGIACKDVIDTIEKVYQEMI